VIRIESSERHKVRKHKDIKGKRFMGLFGTEESKHRNDRKCKKRV
jgi:hypothetical protein